MGFGKTGPSGVEKSTEKENSTEEVDVVQINENNPETIVGSSLKRGWTSGKKKL